ncbi:Carbon monoxide dehydrogenase medium chain [Pseudovibrio axinellae]|uniref:Carbon monoxide dehydrogenase medium chain n=1 Tax=Pseudovibrio axinellae TaxID=989403 RepID=A0A161X8F4_9HYPH|nr:xanthine dehydrogenase family protein subunit M [Pseudovibrio axinellae]KZL05411.1 Carbon monoxide dehydrogenase medium chain [Pseudovibrio axinellae]SEQ00416.1 carbon monoxide dehydrogenase, medium subunit [Pseudovibrio axinellae]
MIPGDFEFKQPASKDEALSMLRDGGDDARPLLGGQSLIPMMKLRMASPDILVDLRGLDDLRHISIGKSIHIGAAVTQHELIGSEELFNVCPIIRETALVIADPQIRYSGTIGGNVANGDPGNDMPALMQCLDATYILESSEGIREVKARDFYEAAYFTALQTGEIVTGIRFPKPESGHGYSYQKLKRKVGDYATAAAAVVLSLSGDNVKSASVALTNLADTPLFVEKAEDILVGSQLTLNTIRATMDAAEAIMEPVSDGRGSREYRTKMGGIMVKRAIEQAAMRADGTAKGGLFGWLKR